MDKFGKISEFLKNVTDEQHSLRRLPIYFFLICILLVVLIFKIGETNNKLEIIAENAGAYITYETKPDTKSNNNTLEIFSEEDKGIEDVIPQFESETTSDIAEDELTENTVSHEPESNIQNTSSTTLHTESTAKETTTSAPKTNSTPDTTAASTQKTQENTTANSNNNSSTKTTYVINISSKKIHKSDCSFVNQMKESNKLVVTLSDAEHSEYLKNGYSPCSRCGG